MSSVITTRRCTALVVLSLAQLVSMERSGGSPGHNPASPPARGHPSRRPTQAGGRQLTRPPAHISLSLSRPLSPPSAQSCFGTRIHTHLEGLCQLLLPVVYGRHGLGVVAKPQVLGVDSDRHLPRARTRYTEGRRTTRGTKCANRISSTALISALFGQVTAAGRVLGYYHRPSVGDEPRRRRPEHQHIVHG